MNDRRFTPDDLQRLAPDPRIGVLATADADGLPHVTLVTTLAANGPDALVFGQFCEGRGKDNLRHEPRVGFVLMDPGRRWWRGRAHWTHAERTGAHVDAYNQKPLFRYNAYFGIHTAHHLELMAIDGRGRLSIPRLLAGTAAAVALAPVARPPRGEPALKPWAEHHLSSPSTLGFLAWLDEDGAPRVVPGVAHAPVAGRRLILAPTLALEAIRDIPARAPVALFALNLRTESVLVGGALRWRAVPGGALVGVLDIDRVYNSMPPLAGPIWPERPLSAVVRF